MKKTIKALAAVMVVFTLCLGLLAGCASSSIVGRWEATTIQMGEIEMDISGMAAYGMGSMAMEFKADGTVDGYTDGELSGTLTYTDNGGGSYTIEGEQIVTLQGGKLHMTDSNMGMTIIFVKK